MDKYEWNIRLAPTRNADVGVANMPGKLNRSFETRDFSIDDGYAGTRVRLAFGVHIDKSPDWNEPGQTNALVEVRAKIVPKGGSTFDNSLWKPIGKDVWDKFLDIYAVDPREYRMHSVHKDMRNLMVVGDDGKTVYFKCCIDAKYGMLKNRVSEIYLSLFLAKRAESFSTFLKYHDRINTFSDLVAICDAMGGLAAVSYNVKHKRHVIWKRDLLEKLNGYRAQLAEKEAALNMIYEQAADAMNELSDRFGIEVDVTDGE